MNPFKVHQMVEYIRVAGFEADIQDLEEQTLQEILAEYGFCKRLTSEEQVLMMEALMNMAKANQIREVARLVHQEEETGPEGELIPLLKRYKKRSPKRGLEVG